jgi:hypothetical protein
MIWFLDRAGEQLSYEICQKGEGRYLLVIKGADGSERIEEIDEPTELIERSVTYMQHFHNHGWSVEKIAK